MLCRGRRGNKYVLCESFNRLDKDIGCYYPAGAPASHPVQLGKAVNDDDVRRVTQRRGHRGSVGQPVIDLVNNQGTAQFGHGIGDFCHGIVRDNSAGGI